MNQLDNVTTNEESPAKTHGYPDVNLAAAKSIKALESCSVEPVKEPSPAGSHTVVHGLYVEDVSSFNELMALGPLTKEEEEIDRNKVTLLLDEGDPDPLRTIADVHRVVCKKHICVQGPFSNPLRADDYPSKLNGDEVMLYLTTSTISPSYLTEDESKLVVRTAIEVFHLSSSSVIEEVKDIEDWPAVRLALEASGTVLSEFLFLTEKDYCSPVDLRSIQAVRRDAAIDKFISLDGVKSNDQQTEKPIYVIKPRIPDYRHYVNHYQPKAQSHYQREAILRASESFKVSAFGADRIPVNQELFVLGPRTGLDASIPTEITSQLTDSLLSEPALKATYCKLPWRSTLVDLLVYRLALGLEIEGTWVSKFRLGSTEFTWMRNSWVYEPAGKDSSMHGVIMIRTALRSIDDGSVITSHLGSSTEYIPVMYLPNLEDIATARYPALQDVPVELLHEARHELIASALVESLSTGTFPVHCLHPQLQAYVLNPDLLASLL